ncbi:MAG: hypothetical protein QNJ97_10270 [Myxococcota bacterium]|nr:hypothetical protein [Myxococcota bacterium]
MQPTAIARDASNAILAPTTQTPVHIAPGDPLNAWVRLKLPLTPPPGVQQVAAREGWEGTFVRSDAIAPNGIDAVIRYPATVFRIRPEDRVDVYRVHIKTVPWMLPGTYDLILRGPGMRAMAREAVAVSVQPADARGAVGIAWTGPSEVTLINDTPSLVKRDFNLIVPRDIPGYQVRLDGAVTRPDWVTWADPEISQSRGRRVLQFTIPIPGKGPAGPGKRVLTFSPVPEAPCRATIKWVDGHTDIGPMAWRGLAFRSGDVEPISTLWDFGDGAHGMGLTVRHRFIYSDQVDVKAVGLDWQGRTCQARSKIALSNARLTQGCACAGGIGTRRAGWFDVLRRAMGY